jgi:hypothetical protein
MTWNRLIPIPQPTGLAKSPLTFFRIGMRVDLGIVQTHMPNILCWALHAPAGASTCQVCCIKQLSFEICEGIRKASVVNSHHARDGMIGPH